MTTPWLSILVPVYNVKEYLEECVRSVVEQADPRVEMLLCDDCSTDGSLALAERLAALFPGQVRVIRRAENGGISAARNSMIEEARGTYFWFLDSDDYLLPGAIAAVRKVVDRHAPQLIGGNYRKRRIPKFAFSGPVNQLLTDSDTIASGICLSRKMYSWLKISHRDLWTQGRRFPEGKYFEDAMTTPFLAIDAKSFFHIRNNLLEYRIRPGSTLSDITRTPDRFNVEKHLDLAHALDGFTEELDRRGTPMPKTRFAASHFIAMEYAKIVERIERAGEAGCDGGDPLATARRFEAIMGSASHIPFAELEGEYLKRGRLIARRKLRKALAFSRGE